MLIRNRSSIPFLLINIFLFALLLLLTSSVHSLGQRRFYEQPPQLGRVVRHTGVVPRARGSSTVSITVRHGRAAIQGQLQSDPLVLWCQAVDAQNLRKHLATEEMHFVHNGQTYPARLSAENNNGSLVIDQVQISHAGLWTCYIRTTQYGKLNGEINVFVRPVVFSNSSLRIDDLMDSKFHFEASGVSIIRGQDTKMECPVFGHPKPEIVWRRGAQDVELNDRVRMENGTLLFRNVTYEDEGTYTCKAFNSFGRRSGEKRQQFSVTIERKLRVKNELAWLIPLGIILVTVILLVLTIVLCEIKKRRNEQKHLLDGGNDEE